MYYEDHEARTSALANSGTSPSELAFPFPLLQSRRPHKIAMTNTEEKPNGGGQTPSKTPSQPEQLNRYDWDFPALKSADVFEVMACCHFEYARESSSISAHYNGGNSIESYTGGSMYNARVDGILTRRPNPFVWPWSSQKYGRLFVKSWQEMDPTWRTNVRQHYEGKVFSTDPRKHSYSAIAIG
jgi:hypothetical protein